MAQWWSIEVLHGGFSAFRWQEQHDSAMIEAALTNGAVNGAWHADRWGVAFEVCFDDEERWEVFRSLPAVRAALDGVPDPVGGLFVYRGRGGGAASREPRKPKAGARGERHLAAGAGGRAGRGSDRDLAAGSARERARGVTGTAVIRRPGRTRPRCSVSQVRVMPCLQG